MTYRRFYVTKVILAFYFTLRYRTSPLMKHRHQVILTDGREPQRREERGSC
jgi:hypothetical protein